MAQVGPKKWHLSRETGRPNLCRAEIRECPVGGEHFFDKGLAREAYERRKKHHEIPAGMRKPATKDTRKLENPKVEKALELANELVSEHLPTFWSVKLLNAKRTLGYCDYRNNRIVLSRSWMEVLPDDEVRDTILHEIAHAQAGHKAGHGSEWRRIASNLGANPDRCYEGGAELKEEPPWVATCKNGHRITAYRAPQVVQACGKCGRAFSMENVFQWKYKGQEILPSKVSAKYAANYSRMATHFAQV